MDDYTRYVFDSRWRTHARRYAKVNGVNSSYAINLKDAKRALQDELAVDTGFLPDGTIRYAEKNGRVEIAIKKPSCVVSVSVTKTTNSLVVKGTEVKFKEVWRGKVKLPNAIIVVELEKSGVHFSAEPRIYALKNSGDLADGLYFYPFYNVFTPDANICGDDNLKHLKVSTVRGAGGAYDLYLASPFTTDLTPMANSSGGLIDKLSNITKPFDETILVRVEENRVPEILK